MGRHKRAGGGSSHHSHAFGFGNLGSPEAQSINTVQQSDETRKKTSLCFVYFFAE